MLLTYAGLVSKSFSPFITLTIHMVRGNSVAQLPSSFITHGLIPSICGIWKLSSVPGASRTKLCPSVQGTRFSASGSGISLTVSPNHFVLKAFIVIRFCAVATSPPPPLDQVNSSVVASTIWVCHDSHSLQDYSVPHSSIAELSCKYLA